MSNDGEMIALKKRLAGRTKRAVGKSSRLVIIAQDTRCGCFSLCIDSVGFTGLQAAEGLE